MLEVFRNAWKVQDLRKKILFTLFIIIIYRVGGAIPVPFLDPDQLKEWFSNSSNSGDIFAYLDILSGGNFGKATLLALSVYPYINAQIIIQLLTYALPPLERLAKEGMEGRKKLNKITKYFALAISVFQAWAYYLTLKNAASSGYQVLSYTDGFSKVFSEIVIIACFVAGSSVVIWLGDKIMEKGIGNGVSMLLFAGIIARGPSAVKSLISLVTDGWEAKNIILVSAVLIVFLLMIAFIIFMNNSERRIPIQYAKRVVGRKTYGGQSTFIPIKIAMSGVLPIIFAMSFMSIPQTLKMFIPRLNNGYGWVEKIVDLFDYTSLFYAVLYFILIIAFNYFYVSMQYNPLEIANNLRQNNGGIPGIRPGKPTQDYIAKILSKITLVGAVFLGVIAVFPIFFGAASGLNIAMGGTSILIVVSVALETMRTLESQMMMRHHKGFLE